MTLHLNAIVGQAHALLYSGQAQSSPGRKAVWQFYMTDFPALLQKYRRYFYAAVAISIIRRNFRVLACHYAARQEAAFSFRRNSASRLEMWKSGKVADTAHAEFSASLMTHNLMVGIFSSTMGIAGGDSHLFILCSRMAPCLARCPPLMTQVHQHQNFWPGILPHGIAELTAIFICGAGGLLFGVALLLPRPYSRADALRLYGLDAIKLTLGTIPLFIFAGVIEGMFSHLALLARPALRFRRRQRRPVVSVPVSAPPFAGKCRPPRKHAELASGLARITGEKEIQGKGKREKVKGKHGVFASLAQTL